MTSILLSTFVSVVEVLIKASDTTEDISDTDLQTPIKDALSQYSKDFPDEAINDVAGNGGIYYNLASLTGWSDGFSTMLRIEYPAAVIASNETPTFLESVDWDANYWVGTINYLRFVNVTPASGETFRARYTIPYTFSTGTSAAVDIPNEHFYSICKLAACFACRVIAAKFSRLGDSPLGVDSAAHTTKAQEFRNRADDYCRQYRLEMGLPAADATGTQRAASAYADMNTAPEWQAGRRYVFHRGR